MENSNNIRTIMSTTGVLIVVGACVFGGILTYAMLKGKSLEDVVGSLASQLSEQSAQLVRQNEELARQAQSLATQNNNNN